VLEPGDGFDEHWRARDQIPEPVGHAAQVESPARVQETGRQKGDPFREIDSRAELREKPLSLR
jgi:hypothetical protein